MSCERSHDLGRLQRTALQPAGRRRRSRRTSQFTRRPLLGTDSPDTRMARRRPGADEYGLPSSRATAAPGKSLLALMLATAVSSGGSWLGRNVRRGRSIFLSAEDDDDELHRRLADILCAYAAELRRHRRSHNAIGRGRGCFARGRDPVVTNADRALPRARGEGRGRGTGTRGYRHWPTCIRPTRTTARKYASSSGESSSGPRHPAALRRCATRTPVANRPLLRHGVLGLDRLE